MSDEGKAEIGHYQGRQDRGVKPLKASGAPMIRKFLKAPHELQDTRAKLADTRTQLAEAEELAAKDHLTGLLNKRAFDERLQAEVARATRSGHPLSVAIIDLDKFKSINDTYGHPTGDATLKTTAALIRRMLRESDIPARYGGEEIAIIFPETTEEDSLITLNRLLNGMPEVGEGIRAVDRNFTGHPTFSGGVAELDETHTIEGIIKKADERLYLAKTNGRNNVVGRVREEQLAQEKK